MLIRTRKGLAAFVLKKVDELQTEFVEENRFTPLSRETEIQRNECIKQFEIQIEESKRNINEEIFKNTGNKNLLVFRRQLDEFLFPLDDLVELAKVIKSDNEGITYCVN